MCSQRTVAPGNQWGDDLQREHELYLLSEATALYTSALYLLYMRVYVYRTREIKSVVYGRNAENELVSRIKMADYRKYGNAIAISETKPLYEKRLF